MEKQQIDIELIQDYLEGNLNEDERIATNQRLVDDDGFRRLFDHMELMIEGIRNSGSKSLLEEKVEKLESALVTMESEEESIGFNKGSQITDNETKAEHLYRNPVWRAIAASTVLVLAVWIVFNSPGSMSNDELAASYLEPYENVWGSRSGQQQLSQVNLAYEAYSLGDYERAVALFEQEAGNTAKEITDLFFLGNAYLQIGEGTKAVSTFQKVIDLGQGWVVESKWYMAFGYLEMNERQKATELFVEIRDGGEEYLDYYKKAEKVLSDME